MLWVKNVPLEIIIKYYNICSITYRQLALSLGCRYWAVWKYGILTVIQMCTNAKVLTVFSNLLLDCQVAHSTLPTTEMVSNNFFHEAEYILAKWLWYSYPTNIRCCLCSQFFKNTILRVIQPIIRPITYYVPSSSVTRQGWTKWSPRLFFQQ